MKKTVLFVSLCFMVFLCACGAEKDPLESPISQSEDTSSLPDPVPDPVDFPTKNLFVSDFQPGEENKVGNIWTNRTFCRQGDYIYHFNEAESCIEKWSIDGSIENAITVCYIDTSMLPVEGDHAAYANHLEVVGDYIYLCTLSGETVGNYNLTSIVRVRTDGEEYLTLARDCTNCQFRIVNNTLFYLSLHLDQPDLSTQDYYVIMKTINLDNISSLESNKGISASRITGESSMLSFGRPSAGGQYAPNGFFVVETGNQFVIGYRYALDYSGHNYYVIRYDIAKKEDCFSVVSKRQAYGEGTYLYTGEDEEILVGDLPGLASIDMNLWPDNIEGGVEILSEDQFVKCVADNMLFYATEKEDGIWMLNQLTGERRKINNDVPGFLEYVGDGKVYYYVGDYDNDWHYTYTLCCCNLDGSEWARIRSYS